ncbi:hypothetical protein EON65_20445 [archaeon]|nr:MAG: hypothetical protein EON65_20445 [archaeon]
MSTEGQSSVNLLPFSIEYDGPAPISTYFITRVEDGTEVAHFRGRRLVKKTVKLPEPLTGLYMVVPENKRSDESKLEINSAFKELALWGHHTAPNTQDIDQCLDWLELANVVSSSPIHFTLFFHALTLCYTLVCRLTLESV